MPPAGLSTTLQQGFDLSGCICQMRYVISAVSERNCLYDVSSASCLCQRIFPNRDASMDAPNGLWLNVLRESLTSCIEQILKAASHKATAVQPPTTRLKNIKIRRARHTGQCRENMGVLISDVLLWTPSNGRAIVWWPARTSQQQLYTDTGYSMEDLPRVMDDRVEWLERVSKIHAGGMP